MMTRKVPALLVAKRWIYMESWTTRYRNRLPNQREIDSWSAGPPAGVCVILGRPSSGVVAIDIDADDCVEAVERILPYTPVSKRGQKGKTLFFRGEIDNRAFNRPLPGNRRERLVDTLGDGKQTLLPPSTHPDTGQPYRWTGEKALEDISLEELPELPSNALELIAEALKPFGYRAEPERRPQVARDTDDGDGPFSRLKAHALANLHLWVPLLGLYGCQPARSGYEAVADWRSSNRGRSLEKRNRNLSIQPNGITDFGDGPKGYSALDLVVACHRAKDIDCAFIWLAETSGWQQREFIEVGEKQSPPPGPKLITVGGTVADAETGEVVEVGIPTPADPVKEINLKASNSVALPPIQSSKEITLPPWRAADDLTRCPGLVGRIADWIVASFDSQQPLLAMGAALTLVGTVAGRQLAGPTRSGTHLYVVGMAPTGSGKDHPLKAIGRILVASKLSNLVGPGEFTSKSAIVGTVVRSPACACGIDELGAFLARGKSRQASTHEQGISSLLRTLWGSSFDAVPTTERAGEMFKMLYSPALSIFGTSTAEEFYAALGDADTTNGMLNRFLLLESMKRPVRVKAVEDKGDVPEDIRQGLYGVYYRLGELAQAIYHNAGDSNTDAAPVVVPWRDEFAELVFEELRTEIDRRMDAAPETDKFLARTAEMAVRIATIRAIGIDPIDPRVTKEDMAWGAALALHSAEAMIEGARDRISETPWQSMCNRVIRVLKNKKGPCKVAQIQSDISGLFNSKTLREILGDLVESGRAEMVDMTDGRSDTKKVIGYRLI